MTQVVAAIVIVAVIAVIVAAVAAGNVDGHPREYFCAVIAAGNVPCRRSAVLRMPSGTYASSTNTYGPVTGSPVEDRFARNSYCTVGGRSPLKRPNQGAEGHSSQGGLLPRAMAVPSDPLSQPVRL